MNSWYNNTLDDTVATSVSQSKLDVDWTNINRFDPNKTQFSTLYIANSLVKHANFPTIIESGYNKNLKYGTAYSQTSEVDTAIAYNVGKSISKKLWYCVSELEPWNTGDYTGMTNKIKYAHPKLKAAGMKHLIYLGWPVQTYYPTVVQYCDEINLHCYRTDANMTPSGIWGYVRERLGFIAEAAKAQNKIMPVNIIYSCEPSFAYNWFTKNQWNAAHQMFLAQYASNATATMKNQLVVNDFSIFVTKYGKQIKP